MSKIKESSLCPICENDNYCEIDSEKECWCLSTEFPKNLFDALADNEKNQRCICQACIEKFKLGKAV